MGEEERERDRDRERMRARGMLLINSREEDIEKQQYKFKTQTKELQKTEYNRMIHLKENIKNPKWKKREDDTGFEEEIGDWTKIHLT